MSTPSAGGPSGPNVPPPPGSGNFGQTQPPSGQFNSPGQGYTGPPPPGQGYTGPLPGQGYGGPGPGGPGGQPPKKGMGKGLLAGIAGGVALLLLLCCIGGFLIARGDDDESSSTTTSSVTSSESTTPSSTTESTTESSTSEPTTESTTESSTSEPSSETTSAGGGASFPDSFDGWTKGQTSDAGGQETAVYTKGGDTISVVISDSVKPADFEAIWDKDEKVGDHHCGTLRSTQQCAGESGGTTYLVTSVSSDSAKEVSAILGKLLDTV
ncbi:hypothetical protein [Janibacter terrae]|nr:hypothetical protein [Janibacter terrae]